MDPLTDQLAQNLNSLSPLVTNFQLCFLDECYENTCRSAMPVKYARSSQGRIVTWDLLENKRSTRSAKKSSGIVLGSAGNVPR